MKKTFVLILLMSVALLAANPNYFPRTSLAELCLIQDNSDCNEAMMQLNEVLDNTNRGEFIATHLFQNDNNLGNVSVNERVVVHHQYRAAELLNTFAGAFANLNVHTD